MLRALHISAALTLALILASASACGGDDSAEGEGEETAGETGDESLFVPPRTRLVDAGSVWRGCLDGDGECDSDEQPGGMIEVSAFFMDIYEATVDEYGACVDASACVEPADTGECNYHLSGRASYPVNCLSYDMATAYCEWKGMRLPTEAEWERAARGDALTQYPWGDDAPTCTTAIINECGGAMTEVGEAVDGVSPFGMYDMIGNVSEWVGDYYADDYYEASAGEADPEGPDSGSQRVIKGSAFTVPADFPAQRISNRNAEAPDAELRIYGVRCARDR